jgi:glycerophosphoryl diester phosphodiesterase
MRGKGASGSVPMRDRLVAHRGNAIEHRENSLAAIASAIELGLRYVEFDVQMSADGVPCLIHDGYLGRLYGKDRDAADTCSDALQALGIATLQQAMMLIAHNDVTAFVEIKGDCMARFGRDDVVRRICESLNHQCVVISFDHEAALLAREHGFRIGFCLRELDAKSSEMCRTFDPEFVFCDQRHIRGPVWPGHVWCSWEVSDQATADRLTAHGVELLETMSVRRMSQLQ